MMSLAHKFFTVFIITCIGFITHAYSADAPAIPFTGENGETVLSYGEINGLALSKDGSVLAAINGMGIFFWDMNPSPALRDRYIPYNDLIVGTELSSPMMFTLPENRLLVATSAVQIWDMDTLTLLNSFSLNFRDREFPRVAVSDDGTKMALFVSGPKRFQIWDIESGILSVETTLDDEEPFMNVSLSPDNKYLLTTGRDGLAALWNAQSLKFIRTLKNGYGHFYFNDFSPDSSFAIAGTADGYITKWDVETGEVVYDGSRQPGFINNIQYAPNGSFIVANHEDYYLCYIEDEDSVGEFDIKTNEAPATLIYNPDTGEEQKRLNVPIYRFFTITPSSDRLIGLDYNRRLTIWDIETGEAIERFGDDFFSPKRENASNHIFAISPDNTKMAAVMGQSFIRIYDTETLERIATIDNQDEVWEIAFSNSGNELLAINSVDGLIKLWNLRTGEKQYQQKVLLETVPAEFPEVNLVNNQWIRSQHLLPDDESILIHASYNIDRIFLPKDSQVDLFSLPDVFVVNLKTGKTIPYDNPDGLHVASVCLSPNGQNVLILKSGLDNNWYGLCEIWDRTFTIMTSWFEPPIPLNSGTIEFTDDRSALYAYYNNSGFAMDWETENSIDLLNSFTEIPYWIETWMEEDMLMSYEIIPTNRTPNHNVIIFNWKTSEKIASIPNTIFAAFIPKKRQIISNSNQRLSLWNVDRLTGAETKIRDYQIHETNIPHMQ